METRTFPRYIWEHLKHGGITCLRELVYESKSPDIDSIHMSYLRSRLEIVRDSLQGGPDADEAQTLLAYFDL